MLMATREKPTQQRRPSTVRNKVIRQKHHCLQKKVLTPYYCIQGQFQSSPCPTFLPESTHIGVRAVPQAAHMQSCLCAFAHDVPSSWILFLTFLCLEIQPFLLNSIQMPSPLNSLWNLLLPIEFISYKFISVSSLYVVAVYMPFLSILRVKIMFSYFFFLWWVIHGPCPQVAYSIA